MLLFIQHSRLKTKGFPGCRVTSAKCQQSFPGWHVTLGWRLHMITQKLPRRVHSAEFRRIDDIEVYRVELRNPSQGKNRSWMSPQIKSNYFHPRADLDKLFMNFMYLLSHIDLIRARMPVTTSLKRHLWVLKENKTQHKLFILCYYTHGNCWKELQAIIFL